MNNCSAPDRVLPSVHPQASKRRMILFAAVAACGAVVALSLPNPLPCYWARAVRDGASGEWQFDKSALWMLNSDDRFARASFVGPVQAGEWTLVVVAAFGAEKGDIEKRTEVAQIDGVVLGVDVPMVFPRPAVLRWIGVPDPRHRYITNGRWRFENGSVMVELVATDSEDVGAEPEYASVRIRRQ